MSTLMLSVPKKSANTSASAEENVVWADGYSGWFGVGRSGRHPVCSTVAGFPSLNPGAGPNPSLDDTDVGSIAVTGRQNR